MSHCLMMCPHCGEYTEMSGVVFMYGSGTASGRDKCIICGKMYHFDYKIVCRTQKIKKKTTTEEREK